MTTLNQVRFYTPQDLYYYETDNRPLQDLESNIELVAGQLDGMWSGAQAIPCQDTSSTANVVTITTNALPPSTLGNGQLFTVAIANTCTGPTTLTLNGTVSGNVLSNGAALQGGELVAGSTSLILYDSGNWLVFSQNSGSFQLNAGSQPDNLVTNAQLGTGTLPATFSTLSAGSTVVSGSATFSSTLSASAGSSGVELVNLGQMTSGLGAQAALINWNGVTADTVLEPGQTAYYNFSDMTSASMPLNISCGNYQIYEITLLYLLYSSYDLNLKILPNNATYSGQFGTMTMESAYTNQGYFYTPVSSTDQYGFAMYDPGLMDFFFFDDVSGGASPPFIRTLKIWTGDSNVNFPTVTTYGGGGLSGSAADNVPGVDIATSAWQGNAGTAWTSLGTLQQGTFASGDTYSNLVLVKRLA
jgi:hypothetical protein